MIDSPSDRGTLHGRYRLGACLGRGGAGAVYAAVDLVSGRRVAVKILHLQLSADPTIVSRFALEARTAASVDATHVAGVLATDVDELGRHYIVMELVDGVSLGSLLDERHHLPPEEAVYVLCEVLDALAAVHDAGVVHRDLKPENVLLAVRADGERSVKLVDFGIAVFRELELHRALTPIGVTMASPHYASPEQLEGDSGRDPRVDLWAAAVMFYEMVAGRKPFVGKTLNELFRRVRTEDASAVEGLPPSLDAFFRRALARDPSARFASARAMRAGALEALAAAKNAR